MRDETPPEPSPEPPPDPPTTAGYEVREQCNRCHREVRETVAGECFECLTR